MSDKIRVPRPTVAALVVVAFVMEMAWAYIAISDAWHRAAPKESPISQSKEEI